MAQQVINLLAMQQMQVWSLDRKDPLEKGMVIHAIILAWKIPWTAEPGGLQSMGLQRVRYNRALGTAHVFLYLKNRHWINVIFTKRPLQYSAISAIIDKYAWSLIPSETGQDPLEDIASTVSTNSVWPGTVQLREPAPESNLYTLPSLRNSCYKRKKSQLT